jgi:hypothetical protein
MKTYGKWMYSSLFLTSSLNGGELLHYTIYTGVWMYRGLVHLYAAGISDNTVVYRSVAKQRPFLGNR